MSDLTLPQLLHHRAQQYGSRRIALREKDLGIWQELTWQDYFDNVRLFALGLAALGFRRGDKLAILGDNRPEWIWAELACQALGGVSVGIFQDSVASEVAYVIQHCDAVIVVAEDQEQVDKILEVREQLPGLRHIIYYDPRGLRNYRLPELRAFPDVQALGRAFERDHPGYFEAELARGKADDPALISYTSGTTGAPKGAVLTHRNIVSMGANLLQIDPMKEGDQYLSFLPLAWIGEQMLTLSLCLNAGCTVNFPEEPDTVQQDLREIGPHVIC